MCKKPGRKNKESPEAHNSKNRCAEGGLQKKMLYIFANSKDEKQSTSRTVSRRLVNAILEKVPDIKLEELNLYLEQIPRLKGCYFESRSAIVNF